MKKEVVSQGAGPISAVSPRVLVAVLLAICFSGSTGAQCQLRSPNDTGFTQDSNKTGYTPQFPADFISYFRVMRVVGPGTSGELDGNGGLLNAPAYQQNGVLGPDAYLRLSGSMLLNSNFWALANVGGAPTAADALLTFTLNGQPIGREYDLYLSMTGPSTVAASFSECVRVPSKLLRFARRLDTGGPCPVAQRNGETTCPGINEVDVRIRVRSGATSLITGPGAGTLSVPFLAFAVFPGQLRDAIQVSGGRES